MIHRKADIVTESRPNLRGGQGNPLFRHFFSAEDLGGRADMLAIVILQPGESVGEHPHNGNGEVYLILTGAATVTEDGVDYELQAGEAEFCADGHTHAIRNHTDATMSFLALIVKDRV